MKTPSNFMSFIRRQPRWRLGLALLLVAGGAWWYFHRVGGANAKAATFVARRGPLDITVLEGGSMQALESQEIKCEVKVGYQGTKILRIVDEGYQVTEDDVRTNKVLVELDSSDLEKQIVQQEIQFQSALATLTDAQQNYEIQVNQNQSDVAGAEQKVRFARMDFDKFLGDSVTADIAKELGLDKLVAEATTNDVTSDLDLAKLDSPGSKPAQSNGSSPNGAQLGPASAGISVSTAPAPGSVGISAGVLPNQNRAGTDAGAPKAPSAGSPVQSVKIMPASPPPTTPNAKPTTSPAAPALVMQVQRDLPPPGALPSAPRGPAASPPPPATNEPAADDINTPTFELPSTASIDFSKYAHLDILGDGEAKQKLRKNDDDLQVAQKELGQAQVQLDGTKRLFEKGFVTKNDLQRDEIAYDNSRLKVQTAETARDLFLKYDFPKSAEESLSKFLDTVRELDRTRRQAVSKLAQADARLKSAQGQYEVQARQRKDLKEQKDKCLIVAKKTGLVVYGSGGDQMFYYGDQERIREGATVRERQAIITIPDMTRMSVNVKIHETYIKKIKKGQKGRITVDAFADKVLTGEVTKVGVLPDSQNRWMNPDLKVYAVTIAIDGTHDWVKPGMTAQVEIMVNRLEDVVQVPVQAVALSEGKQVCYVAGGMKPERREVEVGEFTGEFIEIKNGIKEGERVLLRTPEGVETDNGRGEETKPGEAKPEKPGEKPSAPKPTTPKPARTAAAKT